MRDLTNEDRSVEVTAGVPQGSVLGPLLWNILYDEVLELSMPLEVTTVAYADELAVIATAKHELEEKINDALERISQWMERRGLEIEPTKTEAVLLIGRTKCRPVTFRIQGDNIKPQPSVKYLGVILDTRLTFGKHVEHVTEKAAKTAVALRRILPRIGGACEAKRRMLAGVAESVIIYAAPTWQDALKRTTHRRKLLQVQRRVALSICRGYRTISTEAALLLARTIPIDLKLEEIVKTWRKTNEAKKEERNKTLRKWQERWETSDKSPWLHRLLPRVQPWLDRKHGEIGYHLTQAFTGHGCFEAYLHKIKKTDSSGCKLCQAEDEAEHTLFVCPSFNEERGRLINSVGQIEVETLIPKMLESEENWRKIAAAIKLFMTTKEKEERRRQTENN